MLKALIKHILPDNITSYLRSARDLYLNGYALKSYSQEGEDIILRKIFGNQKTGFYVDVGAHHPMRFSNTYFFYKIGWKGINIEAMPGSMKLFKKFRSRDINLEESIYSENKVLPYYIFNDLALNSFDRKLSEEKNRLYSNYHVVKTIDLKTKRLSQILDEHLPKDQEIDFLNIDTEGLDMEVLKSNDWERYRPKVILAEVFKNSLSTIESSDIVLFLKSHNYEVYAKAVNTVIFKQR